MKIFLPIALLALIIPLVIFLKNRQFFCQKIWKNNFLSLVGLILWVILLTNLILSYSLLELVRSGDLTKLVKILTLDLQISVSSLLFLALFFVTVNVLSWFNNSRNSTNQS
jgi:hypothetical protein